MTATPDDSTTTDPASDDTSSTDTSTTDTSSADSSTADTSSADSSTADSSSTDTSSTDSSTTDTTTEDSSSGGPAAQDGSSDTAATGDDSSGTSSAGSGTDGDGGSDAEGATDTAAGDDTSGADSPVDPGSDPASSGSSDDGTASASSDGSDGAGAADGTDAASSSAGSDRPPPYLFADLYALDSGHEPPWATLVQRPDFYGVILKAVQVPYSDGGWFAHNWPLVKAAGGDRYGTSWFRGAYLFLDFSRDGAAQADAYLAAVEAAGGWDHGDIIPIVDAELTDKPGAVNYIRSTTKQMVTDVVGAAAARLKSQTGRRVMLYGRSALAENGITSTLGCDVAWNPSYTPHPHTAGFEGFAPEDVVLWQYAGDNKGVLAGYPTSVPGFAKLDISVFIKGAQKPTLDDVRSRLL